MRIIPKPKITTSVSAHADTHNYGGTDPIVADLLGLSFLPSNYTPSVTGGLFSSQLGAHLKGIDNAMSAIVGDKFVSVSVTDSTPGNLLSKITSGATTPISFQKANVGGNESLEINIDADKLHINFLPSTYVPNTSIPSASNSTDLAAHLAGIDLTLLGALTLPPTAPIPTGLGIVIYDPIGGGVIDSGIKFYGNNSATPVSPPAAAGDLYYNTNIGSQMQFDPAAGSWLSMESATFAFGRNGPTAPNQYYRGIDGAVMSNLIGWYADNNGTVVSVTYTRNNNSLATFDIMASGIVIGSFTTNSASGKAILNIPFNIGDIISVKNSTTGLRTDNVQGWVKVKWRA